MRQDEHEAYDEAHHEVIEGLRRLADAVQTPPDLWGDIMACSQQLLPARPTHRLWWRQRLLSWQLRPLLWGPVVALVCFVAGTFVSLPYHGSSRPPQVEEKAERRSELRQVPGTEPSAAAPVAPSSLPPQPPAPPSRDEAELRDAPRSAPKALLQRDTEPLREADHPAQSFSSRAARPAPPAAPAEAEVTLRLSSKLYEQLAQEAAAQNVPLATLLRQIIETHAPGK
jgi:predicted DNA binding CopG/RHH family protein